VIVTKQDLATPESTEELKAKLRSINPAASFIDASFGSIDFGPLLEQESHRDGALGEVSSTVDGDLTAPASMHAMSDRVASRCLIFDRPLNWQMFGIWLTMVLHRHGDRVLRLKGLLNVGAGRGPLLVEGVQHVIHVPRHLREWPDADQRSRIVFIARDLDLGQVEASLEAFQDLAAAV
jgi:G3E family GTPase